MLKAFSDKSYMGTASGRRLDGLTASSADSESPRSSDGTITVSSLLATSAVLILSACGGGGGAGNQIASTPPPPIVTPTPSPTPTPSALAPPSVGLLPGKKSTTVPVIHASDGGPLLDLYKHHIPLTATAVSANFSGDAQTIDQGASLYDEDGVTFTQIANPTFAWRSYHFQSGFALSDGRRLKVTVNKDLDYTAFGSWWVTANSGRVMEDNASFVGGLETPHGNIPTAGTASYSGKVTGQYSEFHQCACASFAGVSGNVQLSANFDDRSLSGLMSQMTIIPANAPVYAMNDVAFSANFDAGQNLFSGSTYAVPTPGGPFTSNAAGSIVGSFYGPRAQEVGAVWTLSDGIHRVIGSFGAKAGK